MYLHTDTIKLQMLKFIRRYQQQLRGEGNMPRHLRQVNALLESSYNGRYFKIDEGIKRGQYHFVDYYHPGDYSEFKLIDCSSLSSATATAYRVIRNEPDFKEYFEVNWKAFYTYVKRFPKKYRRIVEDLLYELYDVDPRFDRICDLRHPSDLESDFFDSGVNPEAFAYIIHDALTLSEIIRAEDLGLYQYLDSHFEVVPVNSWATELFLKEPVLTPQDRYKQRNRDKILDYSDRYNQEHPVISFRPDTESKGILERKRKTEESDRDLLNRIIKDTEVLKELAFLENYVNSYIERIEHNGKYAETKREKKKVEDEIRVLRQVIGFFKASEPTP